MWLSPPVDDRQSTHLRKLKKTACFAFISLFYVAMWRVCFRSAVFLCGILCWTKLDVWETTELFLHLWGLSISAVKSSLREMFQMHLSATESLENRHENNEAVNRSWSCFFIRWRGISVCATDCVVALWRPHLLCRYFEVQNLVTERTKTGGSSFMPKKSEERVDFNHVRDPRRGC